MKMEENGVFALIIPRKSDFCVFFEENEIFFAEKLAGIKIVL